MSDNRNPIKHIKFSETDYFKPDVNAGGNNIPHKEVTNEFKKQLYDSISELKAEKEIEGFETGIRVAIVELEDKAIAKSSRPKAIFNDSTCPFFGDIGYGKLLIEVTDDGLIALQSKIERTNTKADKKALSAIKSINPYRIEPRIDQNNDVKTISVRLFRFNSLAQNDKLDEVFESYLKTVGCDWKKHPSNAMRLYRISSYNPKLIVLLTTFSGVQSVISSQSIKIRPMVQSGLEGHPATLYPPEEGVDYPVVAVVDSGVSTNCEALDLWVVGRGSYVPSAYKNDEHGTFVSGLVSNSYNLNDSDIRFPLCQSKIFSVEVLGTEDGCAEDIIHAMYEVAKENPNIKVWNLSLGSSSPVSMSEISNMAILLDEFQDRHSCLCVVAAGNYEESYREWPPIPVLNDGISSPGDSVRSLTVGSLAHVNGFVENEMPSHFSRKGPVSNYVQKPEVVHYGGNIIMSGGRPVTLGVNSIDVNGEATNNIGTSFSTPIISAVAANLFHQIGARATPSLVKALIIQNANLHNTIENEHKPYYGWGKPQGSSEILTVKDYESTMVFEGQAQKSFEIQKLPFPIPECLRTDDRKVRAELFITLVYQPELDAQKAFEYAQIDLAVGFGEINDEGKFTSRVPLQKGEHQYETDLVKSGDKWSPVKVYKKTFPRGVDIENWKLRISVLDRDGYEAEGVMVPFSIVLTIRDIDKDKPVYNEMTRLMDQQNWEVSDLVVDTQIQV
jgi:hypothetical protein